MACAKDDGQQRAAHVGQSNVIRIREEEDKNYTCDKNNNMQEEDASSCLSSLYDALKEPLPEKLSPKYISDTAHRLVESLNEKRKYDTQLIEQFKIALETQTAKSVEALQQRLYQLYEEQNAQVDQKLQQLFACLDNINVAETELENFRDSLKKLYQEMHNLE